jgi:L-asparagine transporter-like permease
MKAINHPLTPVIALTMITAATLCGYVIQGQSPSIVFTYLVEFSWGLILLLWMYADARRLRRFPCFDFGTLAALLFPLALPWYCLWSRGWWRGFFLLLTILALFLTPYVTAVILGIALYANR